MLQVLAVDVLLLGLLEVLHDLAKGFDFLFVVEDDAEEVDNLLVLSHVGKYLIDDIGLRILLRVVHYLVLAVDGIALGLVIALVIFLRIFALFLPFFRQSARRFLLDRRLLLLFHLRELFFLGLPHFIFHLPYRWLDIQEVLAQRIR